MADKTYSAEFKTKVAKEALRQDKKNLDKLSRKSDVPVSTILTWAIQLEKNPEDSFIKSDGPAVDEQQVPDEGDVDLEVSDSRIAASIQHGIMSDRPNVRRLLFWSVIGIVLVCVFVQALMEMHQYNLQVFQEGTGSGEFYEVNRQKREATETLNRFGVVDLENGIYRMPIDSAINEMAESP